MYNKFSYSGRHLPNKKVVNHTKTIGDISYYIINHPKNVNIKTENATFHLGDLKRYDKNFIFQWYNDQLKLRTIKIGRYYVKNNMFKIYSIKKDENGEIIKHVFCGAIKISDIFRYGEEI